MFHANIRRFQAVCWFQTLKARCEKTKVTNDGLEFQDKTERIMKCLKQSKYAFN